jgi:hypothetical protein
MKARKPKPEVNTRDRLTAGFVKGLEEQWRLHGNEVLEAVRKENPVKFAELVVRLVPQEPVVAESPFAAAQSKEDMARKLLESVGVGEINITGDMVEQAVAANDKFIQELTVIGQLASDEELN